MKNKSKKTGVIADVNVSDVGIGPQIQENMREYGTYVIEDRAVPDYRDGCKPSQRRILYAMKVLGTSPTGNTIKCARIIGECFVAGTKVLTETGVANIEDLRKGDKVVTSVGLRRVSELYEMPKKPCVEITTRLGLSNVATESQQFRVLNSDLSLSWKNAKDVKVGDRIATVLKTADSVDFQSVDWEKGYLLGYWLGNGSLDSYTESSVRVSVATPSRKLLDRMSEMFSRIYSASVSTQDKYNEGRYSVSSLRFGSEAGRKFCDEFDLYGSKAANKHIPFDKLAGLSMLNGVICGMFDSDGCVSKQRRVLTYVSVSETLINDLQNALIRFGIPSFRYANKIPDQGGVINGHAVTARQVSYSVEVCGAATETFNHNMKLLMPKKRKCLQALSSAEFRDTTHQVDAVPNLYEQVTSEIGKAYLGGGWYRLASGDKCRIGVTYEAGGKVQMFRKSTIDINQFYSWKLDELLDRIGSKLPKTIKQFMDQGLRFIEVVAVKKVSPKPTYDIQVAGAHEFVANGMLSHNCIGRYHPHGDIALYGTLIEMSWARYSLIDFRGNKGTELLPAAAYRYTEARFSKLADEHLACLDVAEMVDNFSADTKEPVVINTRLPYMLMNGASGIAVGMSTNIPSHNLKELVGALIYVAKEGKAATVEGIMEHVQGPDQRAGGRLLSAKKDVVEVYRNGLGKLDFACEYRLEKDNDVTNVIVYGFPDKFSIPSFLKKAGELIDKRVIKYAETDEEVPPGKTSRNDSRFIIRVGVDNKTALEKIVKMLHCSESYQFNVTVRHSDHTDLRAMNILSMMRGWVKWRKVEEKKMLELEKTQQEASLRREELRLKGILNIDAVIAAVKQTKLDPAEHLSKALKISIEDAQYIGAIPVFQLKKANVDDQKSKIAKIKAEIARIEDDLLHLTRVVIKNLKRLEAYFDERRTKIGAKGPQLSKFETTGEPIVCAASTEGKLFAHLDEKGTTNADLVAVGTYSGCVLFSKSGVVCHLSPGEMQGKAGTAYANCVGIAPQEASHILGIGKNGYCVKIKAQQKRSEYPLIKNTELIFGGGMNDDSKVLVWGKSEEEFAVISSKKIAETRPNIAGKKLVNFKPKKAIILHVGQSLCTADGSSVSAQKAEEYYKDKLYVLDKRNVVFLKSGKRKFMDDKSAKKMLAGKDAKSVYPITIPASEG